MSALGSFDKYPTLVYFGPMTTQETPKDKEPVVRFTGPAKRPLSELRASDVPRGMDPNDLIEDGEEKST